MLRGPAAELVEAFPDNGAFDPLDDVSEPVVDFIAAVPEFVRVPELDFEALVVRESLEESRTSPVFGSLSFGADAAIPADPELLRSGVKRTALDAEILDGGVVGFWGVLGCATRVPPDADELGGLAEPEEPVGGAVITALELGRLPDDGGLIRGADTLGAALDPPEGMDRPALALEPPCECPPLLLLPPPRPPPLSLAHAKAGAAQRTIRVAVKTATHC